VKGGTEARVIKLPECDLCGSATARYDFRTRSGPWAYGCSSCYQSNRMYPSLGLGKGQRLVVVEEAQRPHPLSIEAVLEFKKRGY
jgi:hypothetical protein